MNYSFVRSGIAGSYGNSIFSFLRTLILFSIVAAPTYIPTNSERGFPFPAFVMCRLLNHCHSEWWEVVPPYSFDFLSSNNVEHLFMCLLAISMS